MAEWDDIPRRIAEEVIDTKPFIKEIVPITYPDEYKEAMRRFWYAYQNGELSERVYKLTTEIIGLCEGHYTVWRYRRKLVIALGIDPHQELAFVRQYTVERPKNYQLWYVCDRLNFFDDDDRRHREAMANLINDASSILPAEFEDLAMVLYDEPKNYHGWQYRQWIVQRYNYWKGELDFVDEMLHRDPYNNSAWNHRFFVLFSRNDPIDIDWDRELSLIKLMLNKDPIGNRSVLNFISGIARKAPDNVKESLKLTLGAVDALPAFLETYGHNSL